MVVPQLRKTFCFLGSVVDVLVSEPLVTGCLVARGVVRLLPLSDEAAISVESKQPQWLGDGPAQWRITLLPDHSVIWLCQVTDSGACHSDGVGTDHQSTLQNESDDVLTCIPQRNYFGRHL